MNPPVPLPNIIQVKDGILAFAGRRYQCAIGKEGVTNHKREGDHKTPVGKFALRQCFYRPDRLDVPETELPCRALDKHDGWCDDPASPQYNQPVRLPFTASCEALWREDERYDIIVPLGYNDEPVQPGRGSAIFLHVASPEYAPTEGCVALHRHDLLEVLKECTATTYLEVLPLAVTVG